MNNLALLTGADTKASKVYSDDVFSSYVRTGTGADVTVTTGIDMTRGYMLWSKSRSATSDHALYTSTTGVTNDLVSNTTGAITVQVTGLKSVSSTGHTIGALAKMNTSAATYVDWICRNAQNFYHHTVLTKSTGSNASFTFSTIATLGMVRVKRTDAAGSWYIWHRSLSAGQLMIGETTAAAATLGHITVSGNTVTLVNGVIADGTYLVEAFGHDTSADGIIQCGSFTTDASGNATVNLGWEPQFLTVKRTDLTGNWFMNDQARGMPVSSTNTSAYLLANTSSAEASGGVVYPIATGFVSTGSSLPALSTFIYLAIRRPNKPPTLGTQVYNAIIGGNLDLNVGFVPDSVWWRLTTDILDWKITTRLLGISHLKSNLTDVEVSQSNEARWDTTTNTWKQVWYGGSVINYFFKRAPGVMDIVCYTGTGSATTVAHGLGVVPELMIVKVRSAANYWVVGHSFTPTTYGYALLNDTSGGATGNLYPSNVYFSDNPAVSTFSVTDHPRTNGSALTYVAYLFASKAGISKVFSYTGNGTSQTINCGFTTGARFILLKRTDSTGDWYVWDSTRGIISANDPHLSLNTTAAEVTTDDSVDPDVTGFIANQNTVTNINVTSATYIGLAYA